MNAGDYFRLGWPYKVLKDPGESGLSTKPRSMVPGKTVRFVEAVSRRDTALYVVHFVSTDLDTHFHIEFNDEDEELVWTDYFVEVPYF